MSLIMSSMNNMMLLDIFFCSWSCSTALWQSEVMALGWTVSDPPELPRPPLFTHLVARLPLNYHHSSWISAGSVLLTPSCTPPPPTWSAHHWLREFLFLVCCPLHPAFFYFLFFFSFPCVRNQCTVWKESSVNDRTTNKDWSFLCSCKFKILELNKG